MFGDHEFVHLLCISSVAHEQVETWWIALDIPIASYVATQAFSHRRGKRKMRLGMRLADIYTFYGTLIMYIASCIHKCSYVNEPIYTLAIHLHTLLFSVVMNQRPTWTRQGV